MAALILPHCSPDFGMRALPALVDFEIADLQEQPSLLQPVEWPHVKEFFLTEARRLGKEWLGQG